MGGQSSNNFSNNQRPYGPARSFSNNQRPDGPSRSFGNTYGDQQRNPSRTPGPRNPWARNNMDNARDNYRNNSYQSLQNPSNGPNYSNGSSTMNQSNLTYRPDFNYRDEGVSEGWSGSTKERTAEENAEYDNNLANYQAKYGTEENPIYQEEPVRETPGGPSYSGRYYGSEQNNPGSLEYRPNNYNRNNSSFGVRGGK